MRCHNDLAIPELHAPDQIAVLVPWNGIEIPDTGRLRRNQGRIEIRPALCAGECRPVPPGEFRPEALRAPAEYGQASRARRS